jgi:hypothetical protein
MQVGEWEGGWIGALCIYCRHKFSGKLTKLYIESLLNQLVALAGLLVVYCLPAGEVYCEMPPAANWHFDVQWAPGQLAGVFATATFEGQVGISSLAACTAGGGESDGFSIGQGESSRQEKLGGSLAAGGSVAVHPAFLL